jgi:hypothetical protein
VRAVRRTRVRVRRVVRTVRHSKVYSARSASY